MIIAYHVCQVVDDADALVSGATVAVVSVKTIDGTPVPDHGVTVHQSDSNVCVRYDAEAHGEAIVTLGISKSGSTITGVRAAPSIFLARDSSRIMRALPDRPVAEAVWELPDGIEAGETPRESLLIVRSFLVGLTPDDQGIGEYTPLRAGSTSRKAFRLVYTGTGRRVAFEILDVEAV